MVLYSVHSVRQMSHLQVANIFQCFSQYGGLVDFSLRSCHNILQFHNPKEGLTDNITILKYLYQYRAIYR
jgi:hypothetical protein